MRPLFRCSIVLATALLLLPLAASASDHADPAIRPPKQQEAGLTGLFVFRSDDKKQMIVILNVRRGLTSPTPYELEDYEYTVFMDLESRIGYDSAEDVARYGGTVQDPTGIDAQVEIRFRLTNDAKLLNGYPRYEGSYSFEESAAYRKYAGVRDDPFIFPRFDGKNVVAMAIAIPFSAFPAGQEDWLVWATSTRARNDKPFLNRFVRQGAVLHADPG